MPTPSRWFIGVLTCIALLPQVHAETMLPFELPPTPVEEWQPAAGDAFVADTKENMGYLIHEDGGFVQFRIATGQKRVVRYIGRTYNAATPSKRWTIYSKEKKGDRVTFGPEGTFLRLYDGGNAEFESKTAYGIHSHASADTMINSDNRYRSMGCIVVTKSMMDVLVATFEGNGGKLDTVTVNGFENISVSPFAVAFGTN